MFGSTQRQRLISAAVIAWPYRCTTFFRQIRKWACVTEHLLKSRMQAVQQGGIKARAHLSDEDKLLLLIDADEERTEVLPGSARRRESADDKLLFTLHLELDPGAAPSAGFVGGLFTFTDESFQSKVSHAIKQLRSAALQGGGKSDDPWRIFQETAELVLPLLERAFMEILSVQAKQIEGIIKYWRSLFSKLEGLEELKGGNALSHRVPRFRHQSPHL